MLVQLAYSNVPQFWKKQTGVHTTGPGFHSSQALPGLTEEVRFLMLWVISRSWLTKKNSHMSDVSIAAEVEEAGGQPVNAETTGHKLHWVPVHGHRPSPRWKPLLKLANKKAYKQTAEDKQSKSMNHWKHFLWFDETRSTCSGGVQHVWQCPAEEYCVLSTVKRGGERHGLGLRACFVHWGTAQLSEGNRNSNLHCECPKQSMSSSLRKLDHMVVFQHENHLTEEAEGKGEVCLQTWTQWRSTGC